MPLIRQQMPLAASCLALSVLALVPAEAAADGAGTILMVYQNCDQPGPTPACQYHPYANSVVPANTTMNMSRQLQLSSGDAYGDKSAGAFDAGSGVLYFFQGEETTMYRVDAGAHKVLPPVKLKRPHPWKAWHGVAAAYWNDGAVVAVAKGNDRNDVGGLVSIDPSSGVVSALDSGVDPNDKAYGDLSKGGGLFALGAGLLVLPLVPTWNYPHSFDAVNASTGAGTRVKTNLDIVGLEYSNGSFWALGVVALPPGLPSDQHGQPLIAKLDPETGAFTMVANLTGVVDKGALREAWDVATAGDGAGRLCSTFDHENGIMYFALDPNILGVNVRTGKVVTSSPLVHWADGTRDAEFVNAMQFVR